MVATFDRSYPATFHPFQAALLAGSIPLFLGAMLCDIAYAKTYEVQWTIFASWLIAGGLVLGAVVLVLAAVDLFRGGHRGSRRLVYFLLVLATWVLGLVNALVHAKDVWAAMPHLQRGGRRRPATSPRRRARSLPPKARARPAWPPRRPSHGPAH